MGDQYRVCADGVGVSEWMLTGTSLSGERIEVRGLDLGEFDERGKISSRNSFGKIGA
ncbi:hypothetical protein ABIB15_001246 [Marisediminicola sp. UYEF4]|uniref:hypothetical protein n=1 Tax=Marisediminicola sp. UYEF4 TaxID=1756384 RepID=UPI0033909824